MRAFVTWCLVRLLPCLFYSRSLLVLRVSELCSGLTG